MAGEWIETKARTLLGMIPGAWEETQPGILQGHCPGESLHHGANAPTDCRLFLSYGPNGEPPGCYCLHKSCRPVLDELNGRFRDAIFAKDPDWKPTPSVNDGVVTRAPRKKEAWIPDFSPGKLAAIVAQAPPVDEAWFEARSPIDPRGLPPGEFLEYVYEPGDRVMVFTQFKGPGDFLWEVGRGGYRLSADPGTRAVRSKLPIDGGADGVWFLNNPVDGRWHPNPRRDNRLSRRSQEAVTAWRYLLLESDDAPSDQWLRLLAICGLPIAAIYSSGGRSWHALVKEPAENFAVFSDKLREYKKKLPLLGADPAAITPVRLTRLPGCTRGGRLQRLIYVDPRPDRSGWNVISNMAAVRKV